MSVHNPWREENAGKISEDVVLVIHQVIRAISWGGDRVNKNERMLQKMGQSKMVTHWKHIIKKKNPTITCKLNVASEKNMVSIRKMKLGVSLVVQRW